MIVTTKLMNSYVTFSNILKKHTFVIRQCMETHRLHASARWLLLEKQPGPFLRLSRHFKSVAKHAAAVKVYRPFDTVNFVAKCG
jgi:hypothetical protein